MVNPQIVPVLEFVGREQFHDSEIYEHFPQHASDLYTETGILVVMQSLVSIDRKSIYKWQFLSHSKLSQMQLS